MKDGWVFALKAVEIGCDDSLCDRIVLRF